MHMICACGEMLNVPAVEWRIQFLVTCTTRTYVTTGHHHKCPNWPARCPNSCDPYHTAVEPDHSFSHKLTKISLLTITLNVAAGLLNAPTHVTPTSLWHGPLLTHVVKECPETLVDCKFAEVGCPLRRKRKDMPGHLKDALSDHVTAMFENYMKLKRENEELKRELNIN